MVLSQIILFFKFNQNTSTNILYTNFTLLLIDRRKKTWIQHPLNNETFGHINNYNKLYKRFT